IFLSTILGLVIFLAISKRDVIRSGPVAAVAEAGSAVLVVLNKALPTATLIDAVRRRAEQAPARFHLLVPNPDHVALDRSAEPGPAAAALISEAVPRLEAAAGSPVSARVANSPNAYDDIVEELDLGAYTEIILETPPAHLSHWLHIDLPQRVSQLGLPTEAVAAAHA
ncbi:MAG: hypothetical protein JSS97_17290, partial [Actinobacteria bacterium]|nr:hypothetical protein [Actinomycetota bacterium]